MFSFACQKMGNSLPKNAKEVEVKERSAHCNILRGDFKNAIESLTVSLNNAIKVGDRAQEGRMNRELGSAYDQLGDFKKAINYYESSLKIAKEIGDKTLQRWVYFDLGGTYCSLRNPGEANKYQQLYQDISKEVGKDTDKAYEASLNLRLAELNCCLRGYEKAIPYWKLLLQCAIEMKGRAEQGDPNYNLRDAWHYQGTAYKQLGMAYHSLKDYRNSIHHHKLYIEHSKKVGDDGRVIEDAENYHGLGCSLQALGSLREAADCFQSSVDTLDDIQDGSRLTDELKISLHHLYRNCYESLVHVLLKQRKSVKALSAAEKGRAQALKYLLELQYGVARSSAESSSVEETIYNTVSCLSSNAVFIANDLGTCGRINFWVIQNGKYFDFKMKTVNDNPWKKVNEFFERLKKKAYVEIGVYTIRCENRSLDELTDEEKLTHERSDQTIPRSIAQQTGALRKLYELIVSPIADLIHGDELIIIPDGPLCLVPYAALVDSSSKYLCESLRIRVLPSLTSFKLIADCPPDHHHKTGALLVGDPWVQEIPKKKKDSLQQLPCAIEEVKMIGKLLNTEPLTEKKATKEEVLRRLSSVALVHIAAHGRMETGEIMLAPNPTQTSQVPKEEDYMLTMRDVLSVQLRARLVVLSCCHSGQGDVKAEGVVGIARAFLGAGARSVLVTLWAIVDEATLEFMKSFYQHLVQGRSASEALSRAQNSMRESDEFKDIKHWAPFVLIGDDVKLEFGESECVL